MEEGICLYCGENADQVDLNIPKSLFATIFKVARQSGMDPDLPVCRQCKTVGDRLVFLTPEQKRAHLRRALIRRDGKYLGVAEWGRDEVDELGYSLQTAVQQGAQEKRRLERRLSWPRLRPKANNVSGGKL